ncbi:MAG TPA: HEAT repeat domain-containing protein [Planctomycetaceae bacterium]|nr:HEAT repeat domain-containing protein [Planctomycetaceae bacterium]HQZ64937.1 HEAT repeat domain-containing protein [Planctomycetaceae bacterium]HRA88764.1 HEAT repeat domain-containing protein [Planctomycetaceae bacterium]
MQKRIVSVCVVILFVCLQQFAAAGQKSSGIPRFDAAVDRGLAFLRAAVEAREPEGGQLILAAYAMVKCGVPKQDPIVYGDGLLTLQAEDGRFQTHTGPVVGTSLALLYYMRSTKQWIDRNYGFGQTVTGVGNPFGNRAESGEPTELSVLLEDIMVCTFLDPDNVPVDFSDEVVRSVKSIDDPGKLVGQVETLKSLLRHSNADVRRAACWALGRTGDFKLIPLMLTALRDPSVDVNVEAICALRYIAHKPQGFGETLAPLQGRETAPTDVRLRIVNEWRQNAIKSWSSWYFSICPYEEQGSFDQLLVALPVRSEILENHTPRIID